VARLLRPARVLVAIGPLRHVIRQGRAMLITVAVWDAAFGGSAVIALALPGYARYRREPHDTQKMAAPEPDPA
jgi:hypothetical protein